MTADDNHRRLDVLWRMESPKLLARLVRITGNIDSAEELAQDVLVAALEHWPREGFPDNPAAWLMQAAKNRAIDHVRQRQLRAGKQDEYGLELALHGTDMQGDDAQRFADDDFGDDLLRLLFVSCHPVLPMESRVALTLRMLGGLATPEIARAFLQSEATVAQRVNRGLGLVRRSVVEDVLDQARANLDAFAAWGYDFPTYEDGRPYRGMLRGPDFLRFMRQRLIKAGVQFKF